MSNDMTNKKDNEEYFTPTESVAKAATEGLKLREKFGRGGTEVGLARAKQLKNKEHVSIVDIKKMVSYFARHKVDKSGKNFDSKDKPSNGHIAWLLWGGEAGKEWAENIKKKQNI